MPSDQDPLWCQVPDYLQLRQEFERMPPSKEEEEFRHSGWHRLRSTIFQALIAAHVSAGRIDSFCKCGAGVSIWFNSTSGEVRLKGSYCHDRFCQPCAAARGRELQAAILAHVPAGSQLRFVTLTLRHSALPLADQLQRLRESFATLRGRKLWKEHVTGGVAVLEVKLSKSGQWHPHLHVMVQGTYLNQADLSRTWLAITGDSHVVDVRRVQDTHADAREIATYVAKYVTKPAGLDVYNDQQRLVEFILAMKGQRMLNFLGSWRGIMAEDDDADDTAVTAANGWERLGGFTEFIRRKAEGDPFAAKVLALAIFREQQHPEAPLLIPDGP